MRTPWIAALAVALSLSTASVAVAAPPRPDYGHIKFQWRNHKCVQTDHGFRTIGSIRTEVLRLARPAKAHYQEVEVQVDRLAGYGSASATWRKVARRTWDWSRFSGRGLPTYSTSSIRTGLQPDTAQLSIKATVTLRRVRKGPDKKVWRYSVRSPTFACSSMDYPGT